MSSDAVVRRLNESAPGKYAIWEYEGDAPFGAAHGACVCRYRLKNGLRLFLLIDASAPVVSYFTWFSVGSRHEKHGKTGLAHLFEHLMFNETENLKAGEFDRKLEENGAESNAATWVDWTYYYESLPADRVGLAISLESERMARLVLREPQVTSEKEVVANERRYTVEDDVEGSVSELLYKTAFTRHSYGWPTIGWMQDIQNFTPEDCASFYRTYYAPNNASVVVVGDVREEDVLTKMRDTYGLLAPAQLPHEDMHPEPAQGGERRLTVHKPTLTEKVHVGFRGPAFGDADHAPLTVLSEILFGGRASRLHKALVIDREIVSELRGWVSTFRDPGLFEMYGAAREGQTAEDILGVFDREVSRVRDEVVRDVELERAKARLELALLQSLETTGGKAEQIGFYETVLGDPAGAFRKLDAYRRTTASDIRRVARRYLEASERTVIFALPEAESGA